jgi:uncharacterized integral membrane protein
MSEPAPTPPPTPTETRAQRLSRHGHRTFLYIWTTALVAAIVLLIAFIVANTDRVKVSWVFGHTRTSLIWVIVVSGLLGWLAGIATAVLFRLKTRRAR